MPRRSTRLSSPENSWNGAHGNAKDEPDENEEQESEEEEEGFEFEGVKYGSYQEMVNAKRKRNQQVLEASGLLASVQQLSGAKKPAAATQRGLKRRKSNNNNATSGFRRKSNRLQGIASDGLFVEEERSGKFTVQKDDGTVIAPGQAEVETSNEHEFYGGRLNDGSDMTLEEGLTKHIGDKWLTNNAFSRAQAMMKQFCNVDKTTVPSSAKKSKRTQKQPAKTSPNSVLHSIVDYESNDDDDQTPREPPSELLASLSLDEPATQVAKVCPDRIYSMACHPSIDKLLVCAGDKQGYIGMWEVPEEGEVKEEELSDDSSSRHHLFKYHSGCAANLQWTRDGSALFSSSYDGTCCLLDVATEKIKNVFAVYDDDTTYRTLPGYRLDQGRSYWTQFGCLDHRQEDCFFISTSFGEVYHVDSRISGKAALSWNHELSEKKINTVSLHPNGYALATGGLDCQVRLWDIRNVGKARPKPVASYNGSKSINSAFFSPSGHHLVATTMNHKLDILQDFHLSKSQSKPTTSIRHDNLTGRWLTTFQAVWHPHFEIFGVGSMSKPRVIEIFDPSQRQRHIGGDALTAVASRFAFHPRTDHIVLAGGNSSGRVTIAR